MIRTTKLVLLLVLSTLGPLPAEAEFGVFDRSQEIEAYIETFRYGNQTDVTNASRRLVYAGITDRRLEQVVSDRLAQTYSSLKLRDAPGAPGPVRTALRNAPNPDLDYGTSLIEALASLGVDDSARLLEQIANAPDAGGSSIKRLRGVAKREASRIGWYRERNEIMSSKRNHRDGDDPRASMLINLLVTNDPKFRDHALDQINRERLLDPRIFSVLHMQIEDYVMHVPGAVTDRSAERLAAYSIRLLGNSDDRMHAALLVKNRVTDAKEASQKCAATIEVSRVHGRWRSSKAH